MENSLVTLLNAYYWLHSRDAGLNVNMTNVVFTAFKLMCLRFGMIRNEKKKKLKGNQKKNR